MTELNHASFDLLGVLSGRDYPTLDVHVYFNEKLGFDIYRLEKQRQEAFLSDDEQKEKIDKELTDLVNQSKNERWTVKLKSVSEQVRKDIQVSVDKEFPVKANFLGVSDPNPERDELFTKKNWAVYIQAVEDPDGNPNLVNDELIEKLYGLAPSGFHKAVNGGIRELQEGANAGFETAAKELNFLSEASPEG